MSHPDGGRLRSMAVGGLGRDCVAVMQTTESRQGDNLLSPQRHRRTIPVTSKQLKFCCLTFPKIPYGQKTHLRFQGRGVSPTEGSCRFPLIVLEQTTQPFLATHNSVIPA